MIRSDHKNIIFLLPWLRTQV